MSVHPRKTKTKGTTWEVRQRDPSGRHIYETFRLKSDADAFDAKIRNDKAQGTYRDPSYDRVTVAQWHDRWWPVFIGGGRSEGTIKTYESLLRNHVLPDLGDRRMSRVRRIDVDEWLTAKRATGLSGSTLTKLKSLLGQLFDYALDNDIVSKNPIQGLRLSGTAQTTERAALTPYEVDAIATAVPEAYRVLVMVLAYTGLRPGEAVGLRRRHIIDSPSPALLIEGALVESHGHLREGTTKTKRKRTVPLMSQLVPLMDSHLDTRPPAPDTRIFVSENGCEIRLSNFRRVLAKAAVDAGLPPIVPYSFRHTCASLLAQTGIPVSAAAQWMGHAPKVFLDTYAHLYEGDLAAAAIALNENVSRTNPPRLKVV